MPKKVQRYNMGRGESFVHGEDYNTVVAERGLLLPFLNYVATLRNKHGDEHLGKQMCDALTAWENWCFLRQEREGELDV